MIVQIPIYHQIFQRQFVSNYPVFSIRIRSHSENISENIVSLFQLSFLIHTHMKYSSSISYNP